MLNKTNFFSVIIFLMFTLSFVTSSNATELKTTTVTLDVPGMTCKFCPITIRKALQKVPGVIKATADFDTKTATVTFDSQKTTTEILIKTTANAGYPSTLKK